MVELSGPARTLQVPYRTCARRHFQGIHRQCLRHEKPMRGLSDDASHFTWEISIHYPPWNQQQKPWKWMVGIRSFPVGKVHFQVQTVSFTECKFPTSISFRNQDFMIEFYAQKKRILIGISMDVRFGRNETSQSVPRNHDQSTPAANTLQTLLSPYFGDTVDGRNPASPGM